MLWAPFDNWSSGLGEVEVSCTRGGGAMAFMPAETDDGVAPFAGTLVRKTSAGPWELPLTRRPLSERLIRLPKSALISLDGQAVNLSA